MGYIDTATTAATLGELGLSKQAELDEFNEKQARLEQWWVDRITAWARAGAPEHPDGGPRGLSWTAVPAEFQRYAEARRRANRGGFPIGITSAIIARLDEATRAKLAEAVARMNARQKSNSPFKGVLGILAGIAPLAAGLIPGVGSVVAPLVSGGIRAAAGGGTQGLISAAAGLLPGLNLNLPPAIGQVAQSVISQVSQGGRMDWTRILTGAAASLLQQGNAQLTIPGTNVRLNLGDFVGRIAQDPGGAVVELIERSGWSGAADFVRQFAPGLRDTLNAIIAEPRNLGQLVAQLGITAAGQWIDREAPALRPLFLAIAWGDRLTPAAQDALRAGGDAIVSLPGPPPQTVYLAEFLQRAGGVSTPRAEVERIVRQKGWRVAGQFVARYVPGLRSTLMEVLDSEAGFNDIISQQGVPAAREFVQAWASYAPAGLVERFERVAGLRQQAPGGGGPPAAPRPTTPAGGGAAGLVPLIAGVAALAVLAGAGGRGR